MFILPFANFQTPPETQGRSLFRRRRRFLVESKNIIPSIQQWSTRCPWWLQRSPWRHCWKQLQGPKSHHFSWGKQMDLQLLPGFCWFTFFERHFFGFLDFKKCPPFLSFFGKNGQKWLYQIRPSPSYCCTVAGVTHCSGWWWPSSPHRTNLDRLHVDLTGEKTAVYNTITVSF